MAHELRELIDATPWIDTHEHLVEEHRRLQSDGYTFVDSITGDEDTIAPGWPALLGYVECDLISAGLPRVMVDQLSSGTQSAREQYDVVSPYLDAARATGYTRAMDITTERLFGLRLSHATCEEIDSRLRSLRVENYYAYILQDVANIARCHVHTLDEDPFCDTRTPQLLQQDLSLVPLVLGRHETVEGASGIDVRSLDDYLDVIEWCFERYASRAVSAKCLWAYVRPLATEASDGPPRRAFQRLRAGSTDVRERRCVEDFLFQRCLDLASAAGLPVKVHLGHLNGNGSQQMRHVFDHVRDIAPIVQSNPETTFVLMHMAWPQQEQLLALAKHHANVIVDLCWSWILAPLATVEFVQRFLTTVPATKLLCFGGDYITVETVIGHAEIARRGLQRALEGLVAQEWLTTDAALDLVPLLMHANADRIFPPNLADGTAAEPISS